MRTHFFIIWSAMLGNFDNNFNVFSEASGPKQLEQITVVESCVDSNGFRDCGALDPHMDVNVAHLSPIWVTNPPQNSRLS